jgi:hypothetical protein
MQSDNREDEAQAENEDNDGVNPQTRALVCVELEHSAGRATGTRGASRARTSIAKGLFVVCSRAATQSSPGTTRGGRRGRTVDRGDSRGGASGLGVRA